jgi:ABC-type transport system involved in cytochrome bd biosynthesis fused ATPase/permease subunit
MIIGKIGSGKSSLLFSLLGEMRIGDFSRTKVHINSSLAYCGQTPWLMNGTVRENILLNKEFDQEQFDFAVKYSALDIDVENWTLGVEHIIGDDGSSISGGQRTRIALARCLYQE